MQCKHPDCRYIHGWTDETGKDPDNKFIEGSEGDFYNLELKTGYDEAVARRFHGDRNERKVLICPKCSRLFMV